ncbi:site-specific integrase [Levilactobacillus parabrevis]|uniref:site-specific integrase n=1 Tax=Levilactobacillus parabrevis TaxID=357278 RepID=UPI0021A6594A|nr:site-specific integrase [Levilactobacillus parabrevis]MCT4487882.1 site-specific integrase [Levilactobacillus parabrevis]MCT4491488.1 site-specific integrase [Levilactobacillus parabrevis]
MTEDTRFCQYFKQWMELYKFGAVRPVTYRKYEMTHKQLAMLAPNLMLRDLTRLTYQQLLNDYAETHERQTTMDFHRHLKSSLLDALEEGLIARDPTRKAIIKGTAHQQHKIKYLHQYELQALLNELELEGEVNWDYFILLIAKTGLRFAEALGVTPDSFDFAHQTLTIDKTWDYKSKVGGFAPTKNESSVRKIPLDWQTVIQFSQLTKHLPSDQPIFVKGQVYNDTVNHYLERLCKHAQVPIISVHGLRHTHASLLLYAGVSIASVARRLGHSNMTTTQQTYIHIIQELENQDNDKVMKHLASLI